MTDWRGEAEPGRPYWWDVEPEATEDDPPSEVDLLVIGAGFTGLSAAIAAHDAGVSVAVVEKGVPGCGASTINGGMFGAHPRLSWDKLQRQFGSSIADGVFAEATVALEWAKTLIKNEEIDCDFQETGRIQLAWLPKHFENQRKLVKSIQGKSKVKVELVERHHLVDHIATQQYFGGIYFPEHCAVHPRKYHQGLLEAVRRRGVPVVSNCPVTVLEKSASGHMAQTPLKTIRAGKVILATNGYTGNPFNWQTKRVFALPSFMVATEELPSNLIGHLAPGRRMMVETRARHSYFRLSPDGKRVLWGGRAAMVSMNLRDAAERLRSTMVEIWPELSEAKISHVWTGNTGYTFNHMPHVGQAEGIHYAMGYSGSGTVIAPYLGAKAAYQALGDPRGETAYSKTRLATHWLHKSERPHFLKAADIWYRQVVDRMETAGARAR